jgi:hypothetical protein
VFNDALDLAVMHTCLLPQLLADFTLAVGFGFDGGGGLTLDAIVVALTHSDLLGLVWFGVDLEFCLWLTYIFTIVQVIFMTEGNGDESLISWNSLCLCSTRCIH